MKKIIVFLLAASLAFGAMGCGKTAEEPVYRSDEKFTVGMWVGIPELLYTYDEDGNVIGKGAPISDERFLELYQEIADAGVTLAFPGYTTMYDGTSVSEGSADNYNIRVLKAAKAVGIKHLIGDNNLRTFILSAKTLVDSKQMTEAQAVAKVSELIAPYKGYESLAGFMIQDEPNAMLFDALGFGEKIFKQAAPDLMFYVNLFPVIALGNVLGGGTSINYNSYISQYLTKVDTDYLSFDHYPLYMTGEETSLEASFLYNIDLLKRKLDEEGKNREYWMFLQSIPFNKNRALTSKGDASFQANSFLAYGGDAIQWFCYGSPPPFDGQTHFGEGMIGRDLQKTDAYSYVQSVNKDMQALMPYYKNFDWKGVMISDVNGGEGNFAYISDNVLTNNKTLTKIESSDDAFAGVFEDKDGQDGFMVVNFTDPADKITNNVTLNISGKTKAIVITNGVKKIADIKKGKLTLNMQAGEGSFVIPY